MDLHFKGVNDRTGRVEWIERDLARSTSPEGLIMEEWQVCVGRDLTKDELSTIAWLAGLEQSTIDNVMSLIKSANIHGSHNRS
ncbi:hypothetical protein [Paenibacillus polymyxa]|uniref:Uncharacterized protein n=1 Tax=Paenibacillus polymyxa (strain SC2) TaxID=886882 RepID=E3EL65_PAEPS|nr:hypothetical protein [Paenibacillus polymyxa]ADO59627.1 hypothetical protein PPSC2_27005 [Paenibacillus polymyxa SC2]WPQ59549.1 hypothetical protein SKN87_28205 [Paenibacillus polymyxa]